MKTYLEYKDEKSAKFWEIELSEHTYTVTYGKIGTDGQSKTKTFDTPEKANKGAEKLIAQKIKKGYQEPPSSKNNKPLKSNFKETFKYLTYEEASEEVKGLLKYIEGDCETILYFENNVVLNEDLNYDFFQKFSEKENINFQFIVINGDLTVNGCIDLSEDYPGLIVTGFTKAQTLEGGDCEIYIEDGAFDYYVYGHYNHGILKTGNVKTQFVINSDHHLIVSSKKAIFIDIYSDYGDDYDYYASDIATNFIAEVLDEDERIDISKFYKYLKANKKVMKANAKTSKQKTLDAISGAGSEKLELNLSDTKLTSFPEDVLKLKALKKLDLSINHIGEIPKEIKELDKLEELNLNECYLPKLPDEIFGLIQLKKLMINYNFSSNERMSQIKLSEKIGQLKNLEMLDVSGSTPSFGVDEKTGSILFKEFILPNSIGKLTNLQVLISSYNRGELPESIKKLEKLEKIKINGSSQIWMREFPKHLPQSLKILDLGCNPLDSIPDHILNLKNLEELYLGGTLGYIEQTIPDFSKLPKLRVLSFNGADWGRSGAQLPKHEILSQLFKMELNNLEELTINRWGKDLWNEKGRISPKPEFFQGIGKFKNLKKLDMSFCNLNGFPEDFFEIKNLESLNIEYNSIPKSQIDKLKKICPDIEIKM